MPEPTQPPVPAPPQQPGMAGLLTSLAAGGDNWVKIGIIAMVVLGGGNIFATKSASDSNTEETKQALKEIHALYDAFNSSVERQKHIEQMLTDLTNKSK